MSFIDIGDRKQQFNTHQVSKIVKSYTEAMAKLSTPVCVLSTVVYFRRSLLAEHNFRMAIKALAIDCVVKDNKDNKCNIVKTDNDGDHYGSYVKLDTTLTYVADVGCVKISARMNVSGVVVVRDMTITSPNFQHVMIFHSIRSALCRPGCVVNGRKCVRCSGTVNYWIGME